jgi:hypothetical protein
MLRNVFGRSMGEVTGDWRRLHNEELHDLYFTNISVLKSGGGGGGRNTGHLARMGERRNAQGLLVGQLKERDHLYDLVEGGR